VKNTDFNLLVSSKVTVIKFKNQVPINYIFYMMTEIQSHFLNDDWNTISKFVSVTVIILQTIIICKYVHMGIKRRKGKKEEQS